MTVTMEMTEYLELKTRADKVEKMEKEVEYWKGEYDTTNEQRLRAIDRTCALQMYLVDELEFSFEETWDIADNIRLKHKAKREAEKEGEKK